LFPRKHFAIEPKPESLTLCTLNREAGLAILDHKNRDSGGDRQSGTSLSSLEVHHGSDTFRHFSLEESGTRRRRMPLKFEVEGPFEVPVTRRKIGRSLSAENGREFWRQNAGLALRRGCYLFCMRAGQGITVAYVGQATGSFEQEAFQPHKIVKYQTVLMDYARGTPVMYFVMAPLQRGAPNRVAIDECEDWLIWAAKRANPDVQNDKGGASAPFEIPHVSDPARGRPSFAALELCQALQLPSPSPNKTRRPTSSGRATDPSDMGSDSAISGPVAEAQL
jgi:hypothetical protein